jgi:signal transduction histidine kinase
VERFGSGDLSARADLRRRDEIGDVARAFDQMAERIETLLTAERRLLQDISHELRSPLARLSFAAELTKTAEDRNAAAARSHEGGRPADESGWRAGGGDARGGRPRVAPRGTFRSGPPGRKNLLDASRMEADAHGCRFHFESAGALPVRGDRELLRRAIENVLRNAIRYAPEGSPIDVRLESAAGKASISVRDYGPGVPEEMLPRIFQPFFRVDGSRDSQTGGVGLGLAIAHRAIGAHHGRFSAENAAPGRSAGADGDSGRACPVAGSRKNPPIRPPASPHGLPPVSYPRRPR